MISARGASAATSLARAGQTAGRCGRVIDRSDSTEKLTDKTLKSITCRKPPSIIPRGKAGRRPSRFGNVAR